MSDSFNGVPRPGTYRRLVDAGGFRALASEIVERMGWASRAGLMFGGKRDTYRALGYPDALTTADYRARYRRGDLSARIVEAFPKATWRGKPELVEDDDPDVMTEFEQAVEELENRLHLWTIFSRADILAGLGRYAIILIGAEGDLEKPLERLSGPEAILYLAPYGEDEATIDSFEEDPANPRFGQPLTYSISRRSERRTLTRRVHYTRVLHIADNVLDEGVYGCPRLERVYNRLLDLDKVVGGGSEAFWKRVDPGTLMNVNPDVKVADGEIRKVKDEVEEFINGFKRFITLRGVELTQLPADVNNFGPQATSIVSIISGATGIPQRLLLGSERGELASTQDKENWDDRVQDRRDDFAEPFVVRPFVDRLIEFGALPEPGEPYKVVWPTEDEMTEDEKASVADKLAGLNGKAKGVVILASEIRDRVLGLDPLTPKQIEEAKADATPEPPAPAPGSDPNADPTTDPNADPNQDPEAQVTVE